MRLIYYVVKKERKYLNENIVFSYLPDLSDIFMPFSHEVS